MYYYFMINVEIGLRYIPIVVLLLLLFFRSRCPDCVYAFQQIGGIGANHRSNTVGVLRRQF